MFGQQENKLVHEIDHSTNDVTLGQENHQATQAWQTPPTLHHLLVLCCSMNCRTVSGSGSCFVFSNSNTTVGPKEVRSTSQTIQSKEAHHSACLRSSHCKVQMMVASLFLKHSYYLLKPFLHHYLLTPSSPTLPLNTPFLQPCLLTPFLILPLVNVTWRFLQRRQIREFCHLTLPGNI